MPNTELLKSLSLILNAHQDIVDALGALSLTNLDPAARAALADLQKANDSIGVEVVKHLPG